MIDNTFQYPETVYNSRSARVILPLVLEKVEVRSVLDVGCGIGTWLRACQELGIPEIQGVDGNNPQDVNLRIATELYHKRDLCQPVDLGKKFDLVMCLEVAEHLPEGKSDTLLDTLTKHSDMILFSAAIPGQGGADHINEQWPTYWKEKFEARGYFISDVIRQKVWNHPEVEVWYKQNLLVAVKAESVASNRFPVTSDLMEIVHPEIYRLQMGQAQRMGLFENGEGSVKLLLKYLFKTLKFKLFR